ncbi:hypothetical protein B0T14DRAFT_29448 [Immersiella caudata]|uniref:Uncharacterized protein n=1 Tax=Immersiella caudata TaxID=314043 RepID=A0AA39XE61_9PEZI|nr:hypothetical protein B0T14DRAFT_29448 [Immersiella caudata]
MLLPMNRHQLPRNSLMKAPQLTGDDGDTPAGIAKVGTLRNLQQRGPRKSRGIGPTNIKTSCSRWPQWQAVTVGICPILVGDAPPLTTTVACLRLGPALRIIGARTFATRARCGRPHTSHRICFGATMSLAEPVPPCPHSGSANGLQGRGHQILVAQLLGVAEPTSHDFCEFERQAWDLMVRLLCELLRSFAMSPALSLPFALHFAEAQRVGSMSSRN